MFFAPSASSNEAPQPISTGEPVTDTPARPSRTPEATEKPSSPLRDPGRWLISIYPGFDPANGVADSAAFYPLLDLAYAGSPGTALRDNNWSVSASTRAVVPAGRYRFTLQLDGEFEISVGGLQPETGVDAAEPRELTVTFDHPGGALDISILARDRSGPFALRWK